MPRSKHSFFKYPDRAYLFNDCGMRLIIDYGLNKCNYSGKNKFILLKVDSNKLQKSRSYIDGKLRFYVDQKYPSMEDHSPVAIYTYNNIPMQLIEDEFIVFEVENGIVRNKTFQSLSKI